MCLVIDICCLSMVFDERNEQHPRFISVLHWIADGKGRVIYGGTKYNSELREARKFVGVIAEFARSGKTIQIPDIDVDTIAAALKAKITDPKFNDEHLVALVIASRCCVVCTNDNVAIAFLKCPDVFSGYAGVSRPKIYRGHKSHKDLCCDEHIVGICRE